MKPTIYILIICLLTISCNKSTPAGFWKNFKSELVNDESSDQGPWGGYRNIIWKSKISQTFNSKEIIEFASKNGWTLNDSISISTDTLRRLTNTENINNDYSEDILQTEVLPKWNGQNVKVLKFKTGWIAVEPGNAKDTEINGFAIINEDGTELNIYHKWGE